MPTIALLLPLALLGQLGRDYQFPEQNAYPIDSRSPAAVGNATAGPSQSVQPPPGSPAPADRLGPPDAFDSAYRTGANSAVFGGDSAAGTNAGQAPSSVGPLGGSGLVAPAQSGLGNESRALAGSPAGAESTLRPAGMMRAMLDAPAGARLQGEWVTLDEVISGAPRAVQTTRIQAYWDLCSSTADYYLGLREQQEFARLRKELPRAGAALEQAEKLHAVRVSTAESAARASQLYLASLIGRSEERLPLPATSPHCGNYQTKVEQVFAGRRSSESDELHQLISLRFAELESACAAVNRSQDSLRALAASPASAEEAVVVRALELLALERRAFVQIARDYNRRIARYAELAAPGQLPPDQLIGMLIMRDPNATATRPTFRTPPGDRRSQSGDSGQPTLAGGIGRWTPADEAAGVAALRDGAITPASAQEQQSEMTDRSLLVPRR